MIAKIVLVLMALVAAASAGYYASPYAYSAYSLRASPYAYSSYYSPYTYSSTYSAYPSYGYSAYSPLSYGYGSYLYR